MIKIVYVDSADKFDYSYLPIYKKCENGKYLHDEFSQWRGIDGSTNDSLIIERYKRKTVVNTFWDNYVFCI